MSATTSRMVAAAVGGAARAAAEPRAGAGGGSRRVGVLFAGRPGDWPEWAPHLRRAIAGRGIDAVVSPELAPAEVDYILHAPSGPVDDFTPFTRLRAVLSLWAGVERVVGNPTLKVPLARMVDPGLTRGMVEYVTGHVLRHHLGMDRFIRPAPPRWEPEPPPLAEERPVTVLGLGALGRAVAEALRDLGFPVAGWSRRPRQVEGLRCLAGPEGLAAALSHGQIVVALLPATAQTESILDAEAFAQMPRGAVLINPGRGTLVDDDALLAALDSGRLAHATLDVFRTEPLPPEHPFWHHPKVTVTPHIAAETRPLTAARVVAENIARAEAGLPLLHLVDRNAGY